MPNTIPVLIINGNLVGRLDDYDKGSVSVTADGVKTLGTLMAELFALIDYSKIRPTSTLVMGASVAQINYMSENNINFNLTMLAAGYTPLIQLWGLSTSPDLKQWYNGTVTDMSSQVKSNGNVFTVYY